MSAVMVSTITAQMARGAIQPEDLRLKLLSYGINNSYRIVNIDEIRRAVPGITKEDLEHGLALLVEEGLLTRFARRYCFNRPLPADVRRPVNRFVNQS